MKQGNGSERPAPAKTEWLRGKAIDIFATKLPTLSVSSHKRINEHYRFSNSRGKFLSLSDQVFLQSKMAILMKNPEMFRRFKERVVESDYQHSDLCILQVLNDFLTNEIRIPEMREEIRSQTERYSSRRSLFHYLKGDQPSTISPRTPETEPPTKCTEALVDPAKSSEVNPATLDTESDTTGNRSDDDSLSAVSF